MNDLILPILVGVLLGLAIALLICELASNQQLKRAKKAGMHAIYKEVIMRRKYSDYQYSAEAKRVIEKVHISQFLK